MRSGECWLPVWLSDLGEIPKISVRSLPTDISNMEPVGKLKELYFNVVECLCDPVSSVYAFIDNYNEFLKMSKAQ